MASRRWPARTGFVIMTSRSGWARDHCHCGFRRVTTNAGMGLMDDARSLEHGLVRRPLEDTLRDTLAHENDQGLDRERKAGLSREDGLQRIAALRD